MAPSWSPPYKIRRSSKILSFAVRQNFELLNVAAEPVYMLERKTRAITTYNQESRSVSTITQTASGYTTDPDTGMLRYELWSAATDSVDEYPDIGILTCTVAASGGTNVWEPAVDKYSFVSNRNEFAFDIFRDQLDSDGNAITDAVYIVFNTPPLTISDTAVFNYGKINPLTDFTAMQPIRDNQTGYQHSLFGFEQWLSLNARIRRRRTPHRFLIAFPGTATDFTITESGMLQESTRDYWTTPSPYSPIIHEHDIIIRPATSERFQVIDYTPIYIEDILVSQHFNLAQIDPRSSLYDVPIVTG